MNQLDKDGKRFIAQVGWVTGIFGLMLAAGLGLSTYFDHKTASAQSPAQPPKPACTFDSNAKIAFCGGPNGRECFVCMNGAAKGGTRTECWPFDIGYCDH